MTANELRIGNLIKWISTGNIEEVKDIVTYDKRQANINNVNISDCAGIPLTNEWLLKFGWIWNEECRSFENNNVRMNFKYNSVNGSYTMFNYIIKAIIADKIWYVHQLQNLYFALTREELKIQSL